MLYIRWNHLAGQLHEREIASKVIELLEARHPTALLTVKNHATIVQMEEFEKGEGNDKDDDDHIEWTEEEKDVVMFFDTSKEKEIERIFAIHTFVHGRGLDEEENANYSWSSNSQDCWDINLDGLRINTCTNRKLVISKFQYQADCHEFSFLSSLNPLEIEY